MCRSVYIHDHITKKLEFHAQGNQPGSGTHGGGRQVTGTVKSRISSKIIKNIVMGARFGTVEILGSQEYSKEYSIGIL